MSSSPQFYVSFGHGLINFNQILNHDDKELFHNVGRELLSHELVTSYIFVQDLKKTGTESLKKKGKKIKEEVLWTPEQKDRDGIQNARREWKKWLGEKDSIAREEWIAESLSFEVELLIDGGSQSLLLYQWLYQDINNNKKVEWSGRLKALQKNARYYLAVSWRNLKSHNDIANHCKLQDEKFNWDGDTEGSDGNEPPSKRARLEERPRDATSPAVPSRSLLLSGVPSLLIPLFDGASQAMQNGSSKEMEQSGEEYTGGKFYSLETCCSSHGNIEISVKLLSTALEKLLGTTELVLISPVCENGQGAGAFISTTGVDFKFTKEIHDVLPLKQLKQDVRGLKTTMVVFCELLKWLLGEEKLLKSIGCHLKSKVIICPLSESILSSIELTWHMFGLVGKEIQQEIDRK